MGDFKTTGQEVDVGILIYTPREIRIERFSKQQSNAYPHDLERAFDGIEQQITTCLEALHGRDCIALHHFELAINGGFCAARTCNTAIQSCLASVPITDSLACHPGHVLSSLICCRGPGTRVDLAAVDTHEAAIAAIEERLHKERYHRCR